MDEPYNMHRRKGKCIRGFDGGNLKKILIGRARHRWDDNIRTDLRETE
jgi:hypothetical protein